MELKELGNLFLGIVFLFIAFKIWSNGDKIRQSNYWVVGWLGYIFCIITGFGSLARAGVFNNLPM